MSIYIYGILTLIIVALSLKLILLRKTINEIQKSLHRIIQIDTNNLITISSNDREIKALANSLNIELKKLRKQKLQYENGNQELKRIVTDISHDLRTPLTAISGYIELLGEEEIKQKEYVKIIENKTKELIVLAEQLRDLGIGLDLERKIKKEKCCVNDILEETIASLYNSFKDKKVEPNISICEKKIYRNIDKDMIIRVFENIISNAIKYSDSNCNITLKEDGKISFSNKASKLDVITVKRIFERYYTVENIKKYSGLGLSIAKQLVEMNEGMITAKYIKDELYIEILF